MEALACGYYAPEGTHYTANAKALSELFDVINKGQTEIPSLKGRLSYALQMAIYARGHGVKVIFIYPYNYLLPIILGILKPFHKAQIVIDLFQSAQLSTWSHTHSVTKTAKAWFMSLMATHLADVLFCLSEEYREYYHRALFLKYSKLPIVMDGVAEAWVTTPITAKIPNGITRVIYWGQYLPHHNLPLVIETAKKLQAWGNIKFILCGAGGEREPSIKEMAVGLDNVEFKGRLPIKELIAEVDKSDIVLGHLKNVSDTHLSAANKQIEGMYRGKPVICSWSRQKLDLYGLLAVVLLENPQEMLASAILELVGTPQYAAEVGASAKELVSKIHSQDIVNKAVREAIRG